MALEEFLLDLCEESVTAALLVGFLCCHGRAGRHADYYLDFLVIPNISPRPSIDTTGASIQNMSESVQQGATHSLWTVRSGKG